MGDFHNIRQAVARLSEAEAKSMLRTALLQAKACKAGMLPQEQLAAWLAEACESILRTERKPAASAVSGVHIAVGYSAAASLQAALKKLVEADLNVIGFRDALTEGPVWRLHERAGLEKRSAWFKDRMDEGWDEDMAEWIAVSHSELARRLREDVPPEANVTIWSGAYAGEQTALRYLLYAMRDKPNPIFVVDAPKICSLLYDTEQARYEYRHTGEIDPDKLIAVLGHPLAKERLSEEERRRLEREWLELSEREDPLRIWREGRIVSVGEDYFDDYLLETVDRLQRGRDKREHVKAARVVGDAIGLQDQWIGDGFFNYRLQALADAGRLELKSTPLLSMRNYGVRRPDRPQRTE